MGPSETVERKPQQQTLSIRVSDALREFLERTKQVLSSGRGESVSTSDVAKMLLESAKEDRLDFRLEVADLQRDPTVAFVSARQKWEQQQPLSRAEWVFLSQYIQIASEEISENPRVPAAAAFITLLEAFLAVRNLRTERGTILDRYYLSNLGIPEDAGFNDRQLDPELVPQTVARLTEQLRETPGGPKPAFTGRCFYVALRDESIADVIALNRVLAPFLPTLFRLAARGHWLREHRPIRRLRQEPTISTSAAPFVANGFRLTGSVNSQGEVTLTFVMEQKSVVYPVGPYPEIREFAAMLDQMTPGGSWTGVHFRAYSTSPSGDTPVELVFLRHRDGIAFGFSSEEWQCLNGLVAAAMSAPKLVPFWRELELTYGEL